MTEYWVLRKPWPYTRRLVRSLAHRACLASNGKRGVIKNMIAKQFSQTNSYCQEAGIRQTTEYPRNQEPPSLQNVSSSNFVRVQHPYFFDFFFFDPNTNASGIESSSDESSRKDMDFDGTPASDEVFEPTSAMDIELPSLPEFGTPLPGD